MASADETEIVPGLIIPVARTGHLIAMKLLARDSQRPQDDLDLRALVKIADDEDLRQASDAIALILERGFNRGKDLVQDLDTLIAKD